MEDPLFKPVSKLAAMKKTAWNTLEEVLKPIRAHKVLRLDERFRQTNAHLREVVGSHSYPSPITDAIVDQALAVAREGLVGSLIARIIDPRIAK